MGNHPGNATFDSPQSLREIDAITSPCFISSIATVSPSFLRMRSHSKSARDYPLYYIHRTFRICRETLSSTVVRFEDPFFGANQSWRRNIARHDLPSRWESPADESRAKNKAVLDLKLIAENEARTRVFRRETNNTNSDRYKSSKKKSFYFQHKMISLNGNDHLRIPRSESKTEAYFSRRIRGHCVRTHERTHARTTTVAQDRFSNIYA